MRYEELLLQALSNRFIAHRDILSNKKHLSAAIFIYAEILSDI